MATILNDTELKKLFGTVIKNAHKDCVRPNSYILRLGSNGRFLNMENVENEFELNEKQGIRLAPGHAVGITALETIDFSHEKVKEIFPDCDLHGFLSPTTDLSREGIIAPSTQVDAGYKGTLNWTITNTSGKSAEFIYGEKLFRLTIVRLEKGERPELPYQGDYQGKEGYVASKRERAPRDMNESNWVDSFAGGGSEGDIKELKKLGYPWNILGARFEKLDEKLGKVQEAIKHLENEVILKIIASLVGIIGGVTALSSNVAIRDLIKSNQGITGIVLLVIAILLFLHLRKKK